MHSAFSHSAFYSDRVVIGCARCRWLKRVPQRPLAGIVDYSRVPGARGLELRGDHRKEISLLCKGCNYYSV